MDVHPGLLLRVDGRLPTTTFAEGSWVDKVLRLHKVYVPPPERAPRGTNSWINSFPERDRRP